MKNPDNPLHVGITVDLEFFNSIKVEPHKQIDLILTTQQPNKNTTC